MSKETIKAILIYLLLVVASLGFLYVCASKAAEDINFDKTSITREATITDISFKEDLRHKISSIVSVEFTVDGKTYKGEVGNYNSKMRVGETTTIEYNPENPRDFRTPESVGAFIIGAIVAAIVAMVFSYMIIAEVTTSKTCTKKYKKNMTPIMATVKYIGYNSSITKKGKHPYMITCEYVNPLDDNVLYTFCDDEIWFDIKEILETYSIKVLPVYVDLKKPRDYFIDVDSVKKYS